MEYSAVIHPPATFCSFIHRGTPSSIIAEQITRVWPKAASTDPCALAGAGIPSSAASVGARSIDRASTSPFALSFTSRRQAGYTLADDQTVRELTEAAQPLDRGLVLGWVLAPKG